MSYRTGRHNFLSFTVTCWFALAGPTWATAGADLILTNGHVYTADPKLRWAEAVAVKGGKIIYVGSNAGAQSKRGHNTKDIDLGGRLLLPGLFDSHSHVDGRTEELYFLKLGTAESQHTLEGYRQSILEFRAQHPGIKQLRAVGFDEFVLPAIGQSRKRQPRELLDDIVSDIPVYVDAWTGHSAWVNSKALALAGITKDTPDPTSHAPADETKIDHDPVTGEPNGILHEAAAQNLVIYKLPEPELSVEQYRTGILSYQRDVAAPRGLTGVLVPTGQDPSSLAAGAAQTNHCRSR